MDTKTFYNILIIIENHVVKKEEFDINQVSKEAGVDANDMEYAFCKYLFMHYDTYLFKKRNALKRCMPVAEETEFFSKYGFINNKNYLDSLRLMEAIDDHIHDNLNTVSVSTIAKAMFRDENVIDAFVFQHVHIHLKEYITDIRLTKAAELLTTTTQLIPLISSECGFKSINSFNDAFISKYNYSPKQYRSKFTLVNQDEILATIASQASQPDSKKSRILDLFLDIQQYILNNLATVNVQTIAEQFKCDPVDLKNVFRSKTDISLADYINKCRIAAICSEINDNAYDPLTPIQRVIKCYGFENFEIFKMIFEYHMNESFLKYYQRIIAKFDEESISQQSDSVPVEEIIVQQPSPVLEESSISQQPDLVPAEKPIVNKNIVDCCSGEHEPILFDMILEYLSDNVPNISVESVCSCFSIDSQYLNYLFQQYYDISAKKYIVYLRTVYASQLLLDGNCAFKIAKEVLKTIESQFTHDMKKWFNCTPAEYQALNGIFLRKTEESKAGVVLTFKK